MREKTFSPTTDGIVHDDSKDENEGEEGDHIDRDPPEGHHPDGPGEGDGDSEGYKRCEAGTEEKCERDEDEDEAYDAVSSEEIEAAFEHQRIVSPNFEGDPFGETVSRFRDPGFGRGSDVHGIFVAGAEDIDEDGGVPIEGE